MDIDYHAILASSPLRAKRKTTQPNPANPFDVRRLPFPDGHLLEALQAHGGYVSARFHPCDPDRGPIAQMTEPASLVYPDTHLLGDRMTRWAVRMLDQDGQSLALAGVVVRRMLSAELFRDQIVSSLGNQFPGIPQVCMSRWTDLAATLASAAPLECYMVIGCAPQADGYPFLVQQAFLAAGRGASEKEAETRAVECAENLVRLIAGTLDYIEFGPIEEPEELDRLLTHFRAAHIVELRRRREAVRLDQGTFGPVASMGFGAMPGKQANTSVGVDHLFPWVPSDDSWWRLATSFTQEGQPAALVIHWDSLSEPSSVCRDQAGKALADTEIAFGTFLIEGDPKYILQEKAQALRQEMMLRVAIAENPAICARAFLACGAPASVALLSVLKNSIDDASVTREQPGAGLHWRGGAQLLNASQSAMLEPLTPSVDLLFGPAEASAILRTPMPTNVELAGIPVVRSRTAPMLGKPREGCLLGVNQFRGTQQEVRLDPGQRCRHTYIVGQTGTGKSTLMLHMVLDDIRRGQGVAVLDPHGTLIEDILLRYPEERRDDLVILDVTDVEYPVGFNILRIEESDPHKYVALRDLLIDELFSYLHETYDMKVAGGPIFEMHFRGMLGLLMGMEKPAPPFIPNLLVFRLLYTNDKLRKRLVSRIADKDLMLEEFVREAVAMTGDAAMVNMGPYITSKFNRFFSDHALRAITCQNRVLDLDSIVREGKVLLFYLGKGIIGDHAAGLLASQVVARIRRALMARGASGDDKQFCLYADEFQIFAGPRFAELLAEGRKFGLALTVAHQFAQQIPEEVLRAVLGNVGTTILFRVGSQDQAFFDPVFRPEFTGRDLVSLPNYRAYVRSFGTLGQAPFNLDVSPPPPGADPALKQELRQFSRERYGRPRAEIEKEIADTYAAFKELDG